MKKLTCVFFALAALLLTVPALAADSGPLYDLLDLDSPEPSTAYQDPAQSSDAPADSAGPTPTPVVDVPMDESTYREEPPTPYEPPVRLSGRGEITDILAYWEEHGYPADVSYAFEAGGEVAEGGTVLTWWEIGLVGADEGRQQEILELVSPACLVEFKTCLFTHAEKQAAYDKLTELAADDPNILEVIFLRNDDSVWVAVSEDALKNYAQYLIRDLGLGAVVSVTDQHSIASFEDATASRFDIPGGGLHAADIQSVPPISGGETGLVRTTPQSQTSPVFWVCLGLAVTAACGLTFLALRRRSAPAAVTAQGGLRTPGTPLSYRQVEQAVKDGAEAPDSGLYSAILERLQDSPKQ